jgi:hypothetical protein
VTTPNVIRFNLAEAQEAQNRLDDGIGRDGDEALAAVYEAFLQQEQDKYQHAEYERERAAWLATQCPVCQEGASGGLCDEHADDADDPDGVAACP